MYMQSEDPVKPVATFMLCKESTRTLCHWFVYSVMIATDAQCSA